MTSFIDRKDFLIKSIGRSYAKQLQTQDTTKSSIGISELIVDCKSIVEGRDMCEECLKFYFSEDTLSDANYKKNKPLIKQIVRTACEGQCVCNIDNVNISNVIVLNSNAKLESSKIDINKIVKEVEQSIIDEYGETDTSNKYNEKITDIINIINTKTTQNINQLIFSRSSILVKGTGASVKNVTLDSVIDATMVAIATSCSEDDPSKCSIDMITEIVQEQIDFIRKQVDKTVISMFQAVWNETKAYFIGTGVILAVLLFLVIFLLIKKAMR